MIMRQFLKQHTLSKHYQLEGLGVHFVYLHIGVDKLAKAQESQGDTFPYGRFAAQARIAAGLI
jgi:hypothetical protein